MLSSKEEKKKEPPRSVRKPGLPLPTSSAKINTQRKAPPNKLAKSVSDFKEVKRPATTVVDQAAASENGQATRDAVKVMSEVPRSNTGVQQAADENLSQGPTE